MINCSKCSFEMDPTWRFCPKCGSGSIVSDAIATIVQDWRKRVGKAKNEFTIAELIRELQVGVAGHFERALRDELQKRGYLESSK